MVYAKLSSEIASSMQCTAVQVQILAEHLDFFTIVPKLKKKYEVGALTSYVWGESITT